MTYTLVYSNIHIVSDQQLYFQKPCQVMYFSQQKQLALLLMSQLC